MLTELLLVRHPMSLAVDRPGVEWRNQRERGLYAVKAGGALWSNGQKTTVIWKTPHEGSHRKAFVTLVRDRTTVSAIT